jgi:phage shock protein B
MENILSLLVAPFVIFCIFVAPLWLILHYRNKGATSPELAAEDRQLVEELLANAEKMEDRIKTLESILDHENPDWREK